MDRNLENDWGRIQEILDRVSNEAVDFLQSLNKRPVAVVPPNYAVSSLPPEGIGADKALEEFNRKYIAGITASAGSRYLGFVTGGATPAAIAGDWLVSVFDQNTIGAIDSSAAYIERETIGFLRQLFGLSSSHAGTFVSGATMSNFVGLAIARQWVGHQKGINVAEDGLSGMPPLKILSASPHSSVFKALSMLGMGRNSIQLMPCLPEREAIDIAELKKSLETLQATPCIVVANSGTVNTGDFDDLASIVTLKQEFNFWLHVDAAFGGYAACSPKYCELVAGIDGADSLTVDAHKWLNVPYDCAVQFTRHQELQIEVFQNHAAYLGTISEPPDFVHLTPENSRRFRALPAWFSLMAYGVQGYQEVVERACELAQVLGQKIDNSDQFQLLAPVRLNVVCFTLKSDSGKILLATINRFIATLSSSGQAFLTPTVYQGIPAIRAALSNWRTDKDDIEIVWKALLKTASQLGDAA